MFDESPVEVLKVDSEELKTEYWDEARYRKKADNLEEEYRKNCYMWVVLGGTKEHPVFSYNFRWTRSGKNVLDFLEGYKGNVISLTDIPATMLPSITGTLAIQTIK